MYSSLDPARVVETTQRLQLRIAERFPGSGLSHVAGELYEVAREAETVSNWLARPMSAVRVVVAIGIALLAATVILALHATNIDFSDERFSDTVQGVEALINDIVFVGIAVYFLLGIERRIKRRRALALLRGLRSFAHIVDMHQLTKDPERVLGKGGGDTPSSPQRELPPSLLARYLNYSSELLAIISIIAAIYVQRFDDHATMSMAGDIEDLTVGLSRKIWQKISIVDRELEPQAEG